MVYGFNIVVKNYNTTSRYWPMGIWPSGLFAKKGDLSIPEESFATPESAINYFLNSLKENDLRKAFAACAIDEYSQGFDFEAYTNRRNAFTQAYLR